MLQAANMDVEVPANNYMTCDEIDSFQEIWELSEEMCDSESSTCIGWSVNCNKWDRLSPGELMVTSRRSNVWKEWAFVVVL